MRRRHTVYTYRRDLALAQARAAHRRGVLWANAGIATLALAIMALAIFAYAAGITWASFQ